MEAKDLKITHIAKYHFGLYYSKFGNGINIKRAKKGYSISNFCLNSTDIITLEKFFNDNGIKGDYKETKSKSWARCQNVLGNKINVKLARYLRDNKIKFGN